MFGDASVILMWAVVLFATALVVALGVWWIDRKKGDHPFSPLPSEGVAGADEVAYLAAVQGVVGAYQLSEQALDKLGGRLAGLDKRELAVGMYGDLPVWVKQKVSEPVFGLMVEQVVAAGAAVVEQGGRRYMELFAEWDRAMQAGERETQAINE